MIRSNLFVLWLCFACQIGGAATLRLSGIVALPEFKRVLIEPLPNEGPARTCIYSEGEKESGMEILEIDPENRALNLRLDSSPEPRTLHLESESKVPSQPSTDLEHAALNPVVFLYAALTGKTILQSPYVARTNRFSLHAATATRDVAARALEAAFAERNLAVIPDGEKFLLLVSKAQASVIKPHSPVNPSRTNSHSAAAGPTRDENELIPPGMVDLRGVTLHVSLVLYAELLGGQLAKDQPFPTLTRRFPDEEPCCPPFVFLRNMTPLTKKECAYAFETLTSWYGVKLVETTNKVFQAVTIPEPTR